MNKDKLKKFVNEHKKELVLVGGAALTVALYTIGSKKKPMLHGPVILRDLADNVDIPTGFAVGEITELWKEGDWLNAIVNEVTTKDLGRLGEEFVKHGIVPEHTNVTMLIGFI